MVVERKRKTNEMKPTLPIRFRQDVECEIEKSKMLNWRVSMREEYCSVKCKYCLEIYSVLLDYLIVQFRINGSVNLLKHNWNKRKDVNILLSMSLRPYFKYFSLVYIKEKNFIKLFTIMLNFKTTLKRR